MPRNMYLHRSRPGNPNISGRLYAKLGEETVREIRKVYAAGGVSQRTLARLYNVTQPAISYIVNGVRWGDLPD